METRIKVLGHPVHPMLIVYPLGLFSTAVIFDVLYLITGNDELAIFSFWAIVAGIVGGLLAAIFGLVDFLAIPAPTRAKRVGLWHGGGNVVVVILFVISWLMRLGDPTYLPSVAPILPALAAAAVALVTAWLGGELVYRLGVAVDAGANLDASNSMAEAPLDVNAP